MDQTDLAIEPSSISQEAIQPIDEYFYCNGSEVIGPHSLRELQELYSMSAFDSLTLVMRKGDRNWQTLGAYCGLNSPECQPLELDDTYYGFFRSAQSPPVAALSPVDQQTDQTATNTVKATEEEKESIREEEEAVRQQRTTQHQLLRQIRNDLNNLWEAQRESIISRIRCEPLDKSFEATRRKNREVYCRIEESAIEYWRRSGMLTAWIREMTWREHDFTVKLKGKTETDKYLNLQAWLEAGRLADLTGCYCFKDGRDYIYVGQAAILRDRIKQHEKKTYFTYASSVRIVIPKYRRQLNQLERLLILAHQPKENNTMGIIGKTPVDDCLAFIRGEIKELVTDIGG
jgi:hypothetical protein